MEEQELELPQEEVVKPKKTTAALNKIVVEVIPGGLRGDSYICIAGDGTGYQVPKEYIDSEEGPTFAIDLGDKRVKLLHNWTREIEAMLPSKNEMVANIRKALWLNGAHDKETIKKNEVQKNLMRGAFPYRIELLEEKE